MSEPIPESIPTSADPRHQRPGKRRALDPVAQQAAKIEALFAKPDREILMPGDAKGRTLAPPPEIVANVQGSSAGAGSGEFHVYKASRRREYERIRLMDEEAKREEEATEFAKKRNEMKKKDDEKTAKKRAMREKQKARKMKAKTLKKGGAEEKDGGAKLGPNVKAMERSKEDPGNDEDMGEAQTAEEEVGIVIHDED